MITDWWAMTIGGEWPVALAMTTSLGTDQRWRRWWPFGSGDGDTGHSTQRRNTRHARTGVMHKQQQKANMCLEQDRHTRLTAHWWTMAVGGKSPVEMAIAPSLETDQRQRGRWQFGCVVVVLVFGRYWTSQFDCQTRSDTGTALLVSQFFPLLCLCKTCLGNSSGGENVSRTFLPPPLPSMTQRLARTDSTANERRQMKQLLQRGSRSNPTLTGECGFRGRAEETAQPLPCSRGQHCALLMKANQKLGSYRETERDSVPPTTLLPVNGLLKKRVLAELPGKANGRGKDENAKWCWPCDEGGRTVLFQKCELWLFWVVGIYSKWLKS